MNHNYVLHCTVNDLTEVHANFCEQQITVRKVLVLSDTVDIRLEKVSPSVPTMSRSSSSDSWVSPGCCLMYTQAV